VDKTRLSWCRLGQRLARIMRHWAAAAFFTSAAFLFLTHGQQHFACFTGGHASSFVHTPMPLLLLAWTSPPCLATLLHGTFPTLLSSAPSRRRAPNAAVRAMTPHSGRASRADKDTAACVSGGDMTCQHTPPPPALHRIHTTYAPPSPCPPLLTSGSADMLRGLACIQSPGTAQQPFNSILMGMVGGRGGLGEPPGTLKRLLHASHLLPNACSPTSAANAWRGLLIS